ncbi:MAG: polyprenyl synthetase family protein [Anaerolineales bacterium]
MEISDLQDRLEQTQARILKTIEYYLVKSEVSPQYQAAILKTLPVNSPDGYALANERWLLLAELSNCACGGKLGEADSISAAWYLYYVAAYLMDHAEDGLAESSFVIPPSILINIASGHFFLGNFILAEFQQSSPNSAKSANIVKAFQNHLLRMGDGQQMDLTLEEINLKTYRKIAHLKSGAFFSLACWAGAYLATDNETEINAYTEFGDHLGVMIQILDDLEDWKELQNGSAKLERQKYGRILPALYALEVIPTPEKKKLLQTIDKLKIEPDEQSIREYRQIIEKAGAGLYMLTVLMGEFDQARMAIADLHAENVADKTLLSMVSSLLNF